LVFIRRRQELEDRARERYSALDQVSSELRRLREQRDALGALVEALRTGDGWLAYRAEAQRDQLLELEAQIAEGASAVEMVWTALVGRDEALQRAREDLAKALSYGPPWAHYLGGYQDRLLGGPLGLPGLRYTAPEGVEHKDYGGEVLG
jgi:uncharacterized protein involved in exopolysaccharide biosynthesis